jgi:hypothetical protein
MNDKEFQSVSALPGPERYAHFIRRVADFEEAWSLSNENGWVLAGDKDGRESAPVWPHAEYAAACATGAWGGCEPKAIPLGDWMDKWLPGLARDGRMVAVFMTPNDSGVPIQPEAMARDLEAELEWYE